jgi:hypothetical protein
MKTNRAPIHSGYGARTTALADGCASFAGSIYEAFGESGAPNRRR